MKVTKEQIELLEVDGDKAYFNIKEYDYSFEIDFEHEVEFVRAELDYKNGTGLQMGYEVTFIDITYVSHAYDCNENSKGALDVRKSLLEGIIKQEIEDNLNQ